MDSFTDRYWTSDDGLQLHYRDYAGPERGNALPVICLHGLTRNARDFEELAQHLSATRRVIVPEMRGRGQSEYAKDPATYSPPIYVRDVEKLLSELAFEKFISVGTSMGGLMTILMAAAKPGRIAATIINDIGPEIETDGVARIAEYVGQGRSFPTWMHAAKALQSVHGAAYPDFDLDQWLMMAKRTLVVAQNGRIGHDYDLAIAEPFANPSNASPPNLWLAYEALRDVPMLLVRGELSDLLSEETVKQMATRNPAMRSVMVPRVGHAPTLDETEVRNAIDSLLADIA